MMLKHTPARFNAVPMTQRWVERLHAADSGSCHSMRGAVPSLPMLARPVSCPQMTELAAEGPVSAPDRCGGSFRLEPEARLRMPADRARLLTFSGSTLGPTTDSGSPDMRADARELDERLFESPAHVMVPHSKLSP